MKNRSKTVKISGIEVCEDGITFNLDAAVAMVNVIKGGMGADLVLKIKPDGTLGYTQTR